MTEESDNPIGEFATFLGFLEGSCPIAKSAAVFYFRRMFAGAKDLLELDKSVYERIVDCIVKIFNDKNVLMDTKIDAVWIVTNICYVSSEMTQLIVDKGLLVHAKKALCSTNLAMVTQCAWVIGNVAADSYECKIKCRNPIVFKRLSDHLASMKLTLEQRKTIIWCLRNISNGGQVNIPINYSRHLIKQLIGALSEEDLPLEIYSDSLWTLSNLADDSVDHKKIDLIVDSKGFLESVFDMFLDNQWVELHTAALRLIGNIAVGLDRHTDRLIEHHKFLRVVNESLEIPTHRAEIAWILSNIAAGQERHVQFLIDQPKIYPWIRRQVFSKERRLKKESMWIVANILSTGNDEQLEGLVADGIGTIIPLLLKSSDIRLIEKGVLSALRLAREFPYQRILFAKLKIVEMISPELLEEGAPPVFQTCVRTIEQLISEYKENKEKVLEPILYQKI